MSDPKTEETKAAPEGLQIAVHAQYIRDFSFEAPHVPEIFKSSNDQPQLELGVNVQSRKLEDGNYEVMLMLKAESSIGEKKAFIAELAYGGVFGLPAFPEPQLKAFLLIEGPRILFPFARAILADAVRDGGFPPLMINPIDFAALYQQQIEAIKNQQVGNA